MKKHLIAWLKWAVVILAVGISFFMTTVGVFRVTAAGIHLASSVIKEAEPIQVHTVTMTKIIPTSRIAV